MSDRGRTFTYTTQRDAYSSIAGVFAILLLVEGVGLDVLIAVLVHAGPLKVILAALSVALHLFLLLGVLGAPLFTRHRVTATHLDIHYGLDRVRVPRESLVAARPAREQLGLFEPLRAQNHADKGRIVAAFSERGQILLLLDRPRRFRVNGSDSPVTQILLNVDQPDAFLAALALPATAPPPSVLLTPTGETGHRERTFSTPLNGVLPAPAGARSTCPAIYVERLSRHYGADVAVDSLTLAIQPGEIYGFLGPNGAGKTTTIKMLVGLLEPSGGHAFIAGHDVWTAPLAAKAAFGYVPDRAILYERLTGREFLLFLAQLRGLPHSEADERIGVLLAMLELEERADAPCATYSLGMKRKLSLAGALLHRPAALILDEPFNGLDPRSARGLKDLLVDVAARGTAVMLSTHDLAMAEAICQRIGIIQRGRLVAEGSPQELRRLTARPDLEAAFLAMTEGQPEAVG